MQFLADMCKSMSNAGYLTVEDLYNCTEKQIIEKILSCDDKYLSESFRNFMASTKVYKSDEQLDDKYYINVKAKTRYVVPLALTKNGVDRINNISPEANQYISDYLAIPKGWYWTYFDFDFKSYVKKLSK